MKTYEVIVIRFDKEDRTKDKVILRKYVNGLKEARSIYPSIKLHYCYNAKSWWGFNDNTQVMTREVR